MPDRRAFQQAIERVRARMAQQAERIFRAALRESTAGVPSAVDSTTIAGVAQAASGAVDPAPIETALERSYMAGVEDFARLTEDIFEKAGGRILRRKDTDDWQIFVRDYLATVSSTKVRQITETTREQLRILLSQYTDEGLGPTEIARRISRDVNQIHRLRAVVIARTEVINASNASSGAVASTMPQAAEKEWLTQLDGREREAHNAANGQTVAKAQPFFVDGEQLLWPGDTSLGASAGNVIQCRCTQVYVPR
jgi:hypothetical protein